MHDYSSDHVQRAAVVAALEQLECSTGDRHGNLATHAPVWQLAYSALSGRDAWCPAQPQQQQRCRCRTLLLLLRGVLRPDGLAAGKATCYALITRFQIYDGFQADLPGSCMAWFWRSSLSVCARLPDEQRLFSGLKR